MASLVSPVSAPVMHNVAGIQELNDSIQSLTAQLRTGEYLLISSNADVFLVACY